MNQFFPMRRSDLLFLAALVVIAFISFLPWSRTMVWRGMAMQGWMMAALMVLAPVVALIRLAFGEREDTPR